MRSGISGTSTGRKGRHSKPKIQCPCHSISLGFLDGIPSAGKISHLSYFILHRLSCLNKEAMRRVCRTFWQFRNAVRSPLGLKRPAPSLLTDLWGVGFKSCGLSHRPRNFLGRFGVPYVFYTYNLLMNGTTRLIS